MTVKERILALLATRPDGIDDDEIARVLSLPARQHANQVCRRLEEAGIVERRSVNGKIRNFRLASGTIGGPPLTTQPIKDARDLERPWHWEGNVQSTLIPHLEADGWTIASAVDTSTKEPGKDIVATDGPRTLWVSVKGYPVGTARTNAATQARHWFSQGLFDMVLWRGEDRTKSLMLALPDFPTYRKLLDRSEWLVRATPFKIAWLDDGGEVHWHPSLPADGLPFDADPQGGGELLGAPRWGDGSSRRGYGVDVFRECGYVCVYCGLDMDTTYEGWLQLSVDHVMPSHLANKGYPAAWIEDITNMVTCCRACNEFLNGYRVSDKAPADHGAFLALRDRHFVAKRAAVRKRHADERAWYLARE